MFALHGEGQPAGAARRPRPGRDLERRGGPDLAHHLRVLDQPGAPGRARRRRAPRLVRRPRPGTAGRALGDRLRGGVPDLAAPRPLRLAGRTRAGRWPAPRRHPDPRPVSPRVRRAPGRGGPGPRRASLPRRGRRTPAGRRRGRAAPGAAPLRRRVGPVRRPAPRRLPGLVGGDPRGRRPREGRPAGPPGRDLPRTGVEPRPDRARPAWAAICLRTTSPTTPS